MIAAPIKVHQLGTSPNTVRPRVIMKTILM
jgi:hypothetical protein